MSPFHFVMAGLDPAIQSSMKRFPFVMAGLDPAIQTFHSNVAVVKGPDGRLLPLRHGRS